MPDYSLVPVDYQPDFDDYSLVPVDYDPFAADGVAQQWRIQQAQAQAQPQGPPQQQPAAGAGQPDAGAPAAGGGPSGSEGGGIGPTGGNPNPTSDQGGSEPAPFGGYANPTPTESLVNKAKMDDQKTVTQADPTGKNGFFIDGGDLYEFVTTRQSLARYLIDGGTGVVFTAIGPFYAKHGTRYAVIDASPERPVTVTVRGDGTFTISRP
jgi:hypothetical protein